MAVVAGRTANPSQDSLGTIIPSEDMIRILADENLPPALVGAIRQRIPGIEIESTHEVQIDGFSDAELLEWASVRDQVVLTLDHRTMPDFANERVAANQKMPGVIVLYAGRTLRQLVDDVELVVQCLGEQELQ